MENGGELFPRFYRIPFGKGFLILSECVGMFDPAMAGAMTFAYAEVGGLTVIFGSIFPDDPKKFIPNTNEIL
jgi:hypothetical protein